MCDQPTPPSGGIRLRRLASVLVCALLAVPSPAALAQMTTGSFTGDGQPIQIIVGVGFQPDVVIVKGADAAQDTVFRMSTMTGDASKKINNSGMLTNNIQSLDGDGFTVGSDVNVNNSCTSYYWVAFKANPGELHVDTYPGNDTADHIIAGVGFQPDLVIVTGENEVSTWFKMSAMPADGACRVGTIGVKTGRITGF